RVEGGSFVIGSTSDELEHAMELFERTYDQADKDTRRDSYRRVLQSELNGQAIAINTMEICRYPVTNAQFKLFVDDGGYRPGRPWWDEASRDWLTRDDTTSEDLQPYQRRQTKQQPEYWHDERYGIARQNHPVVGVSWYEVMAFCGWLTWHSELNPE